MENNIAQKILGLNQQIQIIEQSKKPNEDLKSRLDSEILSLEELLNNNNNRIENIIIDSSNKIIKILNEYKINPEKDTVYTREETRIFIKIFQKEYCDIKLAAEHESKKLLNEKDAYMEILNKNLLLQKHDGEFVLKSSFKLFFNIMEKGNKFKLYSDLINSGQKDKKLVKTFSNLIYIFFVNLNDKKVKDYPIFRNDLELLSPNGIENLHKKKFQQKKKIVMHFVGNTFFSYIDDDFHKDHIIFYKNSMEMILHYIYYIEDLDEDGFKFKIKDYLK